MPRGIVEVFDPTKGFGTLKLDTGQMLPFDISVSNKREIRIGESAEVTVGIGYGGKEKAELVLFDLEEDKAPTFASGFKMLQALGFLVEWDLKQARVAAREAFDEVPPKLSREAAGELIQRYYGEGINKRGIREGVLIVDWRVGQVTQTPASDLVSISGLSALEVADQANQAMVEGHRVDLSEGLGPLIEELNRALEAKASPGRYFSLDFDGDFNAIAFRSSTFGSDARKASFLRFG